MTRRRIWLLLFWLSGCAPAVAPEDQLLDDIEQSIVLPSKAKNLTQYGRSYAAEGDVVYGVYLAPLDHPFDPTYGCETCDEAWRDEVRREEAKEPKAGERTWYSSRKKLPFIFDGGCLMVSVEYKVSTKEFLKVACNEWS